MNRQDKKTERFQVSKRKGRYLLLLLIVVGDSVRTWGLLSYIDTKIRTYNFSEQMHVDRGWWNGGLRQRISIAEQRLPRPLAPVESFMAVIGWYLFNLHCLTAGRPGFLKTFKT
jgi:hypothetical protein